MRIAPLLIPFLICIVRADETATTTPADYLAGRFTSEAAGVSLRPPAGVQQTQGAASSGEVVRFSDETRKWDIKLNRVLLPADKPVPLTTWKDKDGLEHPGMLENSIAQFKTDVPGTEVLRQDTTTLGDLNVGMMAARYSMGIQTSLVQQATVRVSDTQYYVLSMTSPAAREGDLSSDPAARLAAETFSQMLDSLQVLDQTAIREDQVQRLFRTRTLLLNMSESKLRAALVPEQYWRLQKDGKDVGYTYVVQEIAHDLPRKGTRIDRDTGPEGVLVGMRTRTIDGTTRTDAESWAFCTFNRKYEAWSIVTYTTDPKSGKMTAGELGVSRQREKPVADVPQKIGAKPSVSLTNEYRLEVTKLGRNVSAAPILRDLPPFYLPQALDQLLPRVIPLREAKTYLFAGWAASQSEVMYRYVDVGTEDSVKLGEQTVRAIPIKVRNGLEGAATTNYVAADGKFLGSVNAQTGLQILPTDNATLVRIWSNADLSRPAEVGEK